MIIVKFHHFCHFSSSVSCHCRLVKRVSSQFTHHISKSKTFRSNLQYLLETTYSTSFTLWRHQWFLQCFSLSIDNVPASQQVEFIPYPALSSPNTNPVHARCNNTMSSATTVLLTWSE